MPDSSDRLAMFASIWTRSTQRMIQDRLESVEGRLRRLRSYRWACLGWCAALALLCLARLALPEITWLVFSLSAVGVAALVVTISRPRTRDPYEAIETVEQAFPDLQAALMTASQQRPHPEDGQYHLLQQELFQEVLSHGRRHAWQDAVPARRIAAWHGAAWCALAAYLAAGIAWIPLDSEATSPTAGRQERPGTTAGGDNLQVVVEPGTAEVERGHGQAITARFEEGIPRDVELVVTTAEGSESRLLLKRSLSDPVWGIWLPGLETDLHYRVEFDGHSSETYRLTVFDYPAVDRIDAEVTPPEYTGRPTEELPNVRRLSVLEGSEVSLAMQLNKPVVSAVWTDDQGNELTFFSGGDDPATMQAAFAPTSDGEWRVRLLDAEGRTSREEMRFVLTIIPNRRPDLQVAFPSRDVRVSPLEELLLEGKAWDDIGIEAFGLLVQMPPSVDLDVTELEIPLPLTGSPGGPGSPADPAETSGSGSPTSVVSEFLLALEEWNLQPDELIAYSFYAEDIGPDGELRRTLGDLFFAEVRPFEEIFREMSAQQGQQQQQQGQAGSSAQQAGQEQKEIVTAIWNMMRRHDRDPPSAGYVDDVEVIELGQQAIRTEFEEQAGQYADELLRQHAASALQFMQETETHLSEARAGETIAVLPDALQSAQSAYRELLKLSAREHLISQNESSSASSSSSSSSQRQQQLEQLELRNDRNRYETQDQQQAPQQSEEQRQLLSRLKELARRQEALNERLQELEQQLREAETQADRERIERELRRLREQQEEMLQDVDELRERIEQSSDAQQRQEGRKALEETRDRMLRASEALEQGQVSRALTEGTRAQRELRDLEDQVRQRSEGEFSQAVRNLQQAVDELVEREDLLREQLSDDRASASSRTPPSLRDQDDRLSLAEELLTQRERLEQLLDVMQQLVEQSEETEPLLSRTLYQGMRSADRHSPEAALTAASNLVRQGLREEALQAEQVAGEGMRELQNAIQNASNNILGSELAALQRARSELAQAARELNEELQAHQSEQDTSQTGSGRPSSPGEAGDASTEEIDPTGAGSGSRPADEESEPRDPSGRGTSEGGQGAQPDEPLESPERGEGAGQGQPGSEADPAGTPSSGAQNGMPPVEGAPMGERGENGQPNQGGASAAGSPDGQPTDNGSESSSPGSPTSSGMQGSSGQPAASGGGGRTGGTEGLSALSNFLQPGAPDRGGENQGPVMPLTSEGFAEWSDRLRDVEEMLTDTPWQGEVQQIRERARQVRIDVARHSRDPNWDLVRTEIYGPLLDLQRQLSEEIARRNPEDRSTPIDRDPAPPQYQQAVEEYFRRLSEQQGPPVEPSPTSRRSGF